MAFGLLIALSLLLPACSSPEPPTATIPLPNPTPTAVSAPAVTAVAATVATTPITPTPTPLKDLLSDLPEEARAATGGGEPRTAGSWIVWNTCAPENRAETARANGGRAAGWILLDDLLADPGIRLGNHPVATCQEGLALLQGCTAAGEETGDPIYGLAAQLLAAELNLNAGGETCPIAEEAVLGGHLVLASAGFDGTGHTATTISTEMANAIPRLVELLEGYNRGELCR
ncbi:MAG: hypothetical protein PVI80_13925 [Anaerolineae bacterium]